MKKKIKNLIKLLCPPIFIHLIKLRTEFYGFYGDFKSWENAQSNVGAGYEEKEIFCKVKSATEKVRGGEALYERDSVLFYKENYNFQLLTGLFYILSKDGFLSVADFGGALGSTYFQNIKLFKNSKVQWHVIEQEDFVTYGKNNIPEINFEYSIEECVKKHKINCLLISGVIQYLNNPYDFLDRFLQQNIPYILIDRTPIENIQDKIMVQKVPPDIYKAQYPVWILSKNRIDSYIETKYEFLYRWDNNEKIPIKKQNIFNKTNYTTYRGFLCQLKGNKEQRSGFNEVKGKGETNIKQKKIQQVP